MRPVALLLACVCVCAGLSGCIAAPDEATQGRVGTDGFSLELGDVTAKGGNDVAPQGARVSLRRQDEPLAPTLGSKYVISVGPTVKLTLGKEQQPRTPIELRFKVDRSKIPKGDVVPAVLARSEGSSRATVLKARYDRKTGLMTVKTPHLSSFDPVFMAIGSFATGVSNTLLTGFKVQYPTPKCNQRLRTEVAQYSVGEGLGAYPCVTLQKDGKVQIEFNSTTGIPLRATPTPRVTGEESAGTTLDSIIALATTRVLEQDRTISTLMPGQKLTFSFDESTPLKSVEFDTDRSTFFLLYTAAVFMSIVDAIPLAKLTDALDCMSDIQSAQDLTQSADQLGGVWLRTFINCGGQLAGAVPGFGAVWSLIALVPQVILTSMISTLQQVTNAEHATLDVSQTVLVQDADKANYLESRDGPYYTYAWSSPDGNIVCRISQGEDLSPWGCSTYRHTWSDPALPGASPSLGSCKEYDQVRQLGAMFADYPGGRFTESCLPKDSEADLTGSVLPYNTRISDRGVTCTSLQVNGESQMQCAAPKTSSLTISRTAMSYRDGTAR